jgi:hypothetical protein
LTAPMVRDGPTPVPMPPEAESCIQERQSAYNQKVMAEGRKFSEEEAGAIIRRAAQLQTSAGAKGQSGPVSYEDLQSLAQEAGIDPALLRQAVLESRAGAIQTGKNELVRIVEGELEPEEFDVINEFIGPQGNRFMSSQVGRTMNRYVMAGPGQASVNVTSRGGITKVTVQKNYIGSFMMSAYPFLLAAFILALNLFVRGVWGWGVLSAVVLPVMGIVLFMLVRQLYDRKAQEVLDRIADGLTTHFASQTTKESSAERAYRSTSMELPAADPLTEQNKG